MKNFIHDNDPPPDLVALVPAGGKATRISPLPCSKEVYPVGFRAVGEGSGSRPKVVSHYLLENMRLAGAKNVYIILQQGKWDIPAYFTDGKMLDMHLAYLTMDSSAGVPYTLDQAYPFVQDKTVVFGFPDIIFQPKDAFVQLLDRLVQCQADIVLGLFPAGQPHKVDMVDLDADGRVTGIQIKPTQTSLLYTWIIAVWTAEFTHFVHEYISVGKRHQDQVVGDRAGRQELFMGDVIQAAIDDGLKVDKVVFAEGIYLDIGTPEDLIRAVNETNC